MAVHPKVKSSTGAAAVAGFLVFALSRFVIHKSVDPVVQAEIFAATPAVLAFAAGWLTPSKPAPLGVVHREQLPSLPDPAVTINFTGDITEQETDALKAAFKAAMENAPSPALPDPPGAAQEKLAPPAP